MNDTNTSLSFWEVFKILIKGGDINDIQKKINDKIKDENKEIKNEVH